MSLFKGNLIYFFFLIITMLLTQSCAIFTSGSRADYAIPGCENAWNAIVSAKAIKDMETLVVNNCSSMYKNGWRLPININKDSETSPEQCIAAWNNLETSKQLDNAKFMVTHNCPVFYRHKWVIPPGYL